MQYSGLYFSCPAVLAMRSRRIHGLVTRPTTPGMMALSERLIEINGAASVTTIGRTCQRGARHSRVVVDTLSLCVSRVESSRLHCRRHSSSWLSRPSLPPAPPPSVQNTLSLYARNEAISIKCILTRAFLPDSLS